MKPLRELLGKQRVVYVPPEASIREAARAMAEANVGCVAIVDGEELAGLFTERDVLRRVFLQKDLDVDKVQVSEVMTREPITATPDMTSSQGRAILRERHIRHLPVVEEGGRLVGVISIRDLLADEVADAREAVEEVHRHLQGGEVFEGGSPAAG